MIKQIKVQYSVNKRYNENIYKGAKIPLSTTELVDMGIDEDNRLVNVEYDQKTKTITISPIKK